MPSTSISLFLVAGEASGDLHTSHLVRELKKIYPGINCVGLGGEKMKEAGVTIFFDLTKLAAVGLWEVLVKYFEFRKVFYDTLRQIKELRPTAVLLIDFPGFNLRLAKKVKALGIPVIFYVSPQIWAWKKRRAYTIPKIVDKMLVILPFEKSLYQNPQMEVDFVGHPLTGHVRASKDAASLREEWKIPRTQKVITLVPGSRKEELKFILPMLCQTAMLLQKSFDDVLFLITKSPTLEASLYTPILEQYRFPFRLVDEKTYDCLTIADFSIVKSGTSTLEATLLGAPYVLVYKVTAPTYWLGRMVVKIPFLGMANIIAGKSIVPEFIQHDAKPEAIAATVTEFLASPQKLTTMKSDLAAVKEALATENPSLSAAQSVADFLKKLALKN